MSETKAQIIQPPSREVIKRPHVIFLAGSLLPGPDWRGPLTSLLSLMPITILDPRRSEWSEDESFIREQVGWELDMQERADIILIYFGPETDAPISLLELGLCARSGKGVVVCHPEYRKRGNVRITCSKYGVEMLERLDQVPAAVQRRLEHGE
jgi:hypothetical protein